MNSISVTGEVSFEQVLVLAQRLRPVDQARLAARLLPVVETVLNQVAPANAPPVHQPLRGLLADLGKAPSAAEIDEVQRTMWAQFGEE
jgi:hypothetical protein